MTKRFTLSELSYFFDLEESEVILILLLRTPRRAREASEAKPKETFESLYLGFLC